MRNRSLIAALFALALSMSSGCWGTTAETTFTDGAEESRCDGVFPVCQGRVAGCVLEEDQFLRGDFPGARKFLVETLPGSFTIRVRIYLSERIAPGSETSVTWFEPGCSDEYTQSTLDAGITDLFVEAGPDRVYEVEQAVIESGDHLVEVFSDATARYLLRVEIERTELPEP